MYEHMAAGAAIGHDEPVGPFVLRDGMTDAELLAVMPTWLDAAWSALSNGLHHHLLDDPPLDVLSGRPLPWVMVIGEWACEMRHGQGWIEAVCTLGGSDIILRYAVAGTLATPVRLTCVQHSQPGYLISTLVLNMLEGNVDIGRSVAEPEGRFAVQAKGVDAGRLLQEAGLTGLVQSAKAQGAQQPTLVPSGPYRDRLNFFPWLSGRFDGLLAYLHHQRPAAPPTVRGWRHELGPVYRWWIARPNGTAIPMPANVNWTTTYHREGRRAYIHLHGPVDGWALTLLVYELAGGLLLQEMWIHLYEHDLQFIVVATPYSWRKYNDTGRRYRLASRTAREVPNEYEIRALMQRGGIYQMLD